MKCYYCGKEEVLPFKCQYCQGLFCAEHRLPENHSCAEIEKVKAPKQEPPPFEYKITYTSPKPLSGFRFSPTEIRDLAISAILVSVVGLSWLGLNLITEGIQILVALVSLFTATFLIHEIAHKIVAQRFGLWAEFRLTLFGALITALSIITPLKVISPGAVMIAGTADKETIGKTSIAGPLTNMIIGVLSLSLTFFTYEPWRIVILLTASFNAFIAVINLIPIGILDGWKIFQWSRVVWALAFVLSIGLIAIMLISYGPFFGF